MPGTLAAVLIARDEEDRLPATLASVAFVDEVVVLVDAASTDRTAEIARAAGATVGLRPLDGFGFQRNAAIALAKSSWILAIDADEIVSPELAAEIRERLQGINAPGARAPAAFRIPIRLEFQGRVLRFGRNAVVRPIRLFHRERARFSLDAVHERVLVDGVVETLEMPMLHRSYRDLTHYLEKLDRYTTLAAASRAPRRSWGPFLPLRVLWEFFDRAVLRLGVLDGTAGVTFAALSAANTLVKYLKIAERRRGEPKA